VEEKEFDYLTRRENGGEKDACKWLGGNFSRKKGEEGP